jgi:hypothetical protein
VNDIARRRARIARIQAKRLQPVTVVLETRPSNDPALLTDFDRWLQRLLAPEHKR